MRWLKKLFEKRDDPDAALRELTRGVQLARTGRLEEALHSYERALALDGEAPLSHLNHALALQDLYNRDADGMEDGERKARLSAMQASLERAVELDPELLVAWRHLGHVSRRLGEYVRAEAAFEHLLEHADEEYPHTDEVRRELRVLEALAERQRILEGAETLAFDDDAEAEDMRAALERVEPLLIHPEITEHAFWATGVLMRRLDDLDGAREMFEACVERSPRHLDARRELATLCMHAGEVELALEHSIEAYREDPSNPALICNVGVCHLSLGQLEHAEEYLQMAKDLAPEDDIVRRAFRALEEARTPAAEG